MTGLAQRYPGIQTKISKAYAANYTDDMIEDNVKRLIYKAYSSDYSDDMIRANLGVDKTFELPKRPKAWQKGVEFLTGGHIKAPHAPPLPEVEPGGKVNPPESSKMGLFEDPVTAVSFGAVSGVRAAVPLAGKILKGTQEAIAWATGGITEAPKMTVPGVKAVARGVSAKPLEQTMVGAVKTASKGLGVEPVKEAAKIIVKPGARVMDLIKNRRTNIDSDILDSEVFIREFEKNLTEEELEALPFLRQGIMDFSVLKKIGKENLVPIIKSPSSKLLKASEEVGEYYDEAHGYLQKAWGKDIGFVENYVTQIWDIPKNKKEGILNYFAKSNPFLKKRTIPTFEEGIKLGLTPKTTNIAKLLRIYDQYKIKTVHNFKFADELKKMVDENGEALLLPEASAPRRWVTIDHPATRRLSFKGKTKGGATILTDRPIKVNPEIAREVKIIFDSPINNKWINAYETVNAFLKKSMLSFSFFHHQALTESAFSAGIGKKAIGQWNPVKIIKALRNKDYEIFKQVDLAKDAIKHNVTFGALEDIQRNKVAKAFESVENATKNIPVIGKASKIVRKGNELWDAALWDYYHNTLKMYAYESNVAKALKSAEKNSIKKNGRSLLPEESEEIKNTIGSFINDSFGGQNWELNKILGNPKVRQMTHWFLLAPDWTFSVLKQAAAPVKGLAMVARSKGNVPQQVAGKELAKRGAMFWAKAGLYYNLIAQSINYQTTKKEYGKGRFTWDNTPGNQLNVYIGRNEDGTERYLRGGKQFREVLEWGIDPGKKLGAKLSPLLREGIRQFANHDPGSGYPTEWADEDNFWKTLPERGMSFAEMPLPFSLRPYVNSRPGNFLFTFPTKKGMTNYKAVKIFKTQLKAADTVGVKKTYIQALENNLNAVQLLKAANASVKADITYNDKAVAKDILNEMIKLDPEARTDASNLYIKRGIITENVRKQMNRLIENRQKIEEQQESIGLK